MAESKPAPGDLEIVRRFVNTRDADTATDLIDSNEGLAQWLRERGLLPAGVEIRREDVDRATALREALRQLMLHNTDGRPVQPEVSATLDDVAARSALRLRVDEEGQTRLDAEGPGVDAALGRLLITVHRAMENGSWSRLKACRNDTCQWGFYDHSKNHSGHWCTMEECGNRVKAREYRQRRRSRGQESSGSGSVSSS